MATAPYHLALLNKGYILKGRQLEEQGHYSQRREE